MASHNDKITPRDKRVSYKKNGKERKFDTATTFSVKAQKPIVEKALQDYARLLVDPGGTELGLSPCPVPCRMVAVRDKIVLDLKSNLCSTGDWYVEVTPTLNDTVKVTKGVAVNTTNDATIVFDKLDFDSGMNMGGNLSYSSSPNDMIDFTYSSSALTGGGFNVNDMAASKTYKVWFNPLAMIGSPTATLQIYTSPTLALLGSGVPPWTGHISAGVVGELTGSLTVPANNAWLGFKIVDEGGSSMISASISLRWVSGAGVMPSGNKITDQTCFDTEFSTQNIDFDRYRITAQDVLVTYMGSDLSNGGVVASARTPYSWSPSSDVYDSITQLPYDSYDGPLKTGTHVHWLPATIDDITPKNRGTVDWPSSKMIIYGRQDDLANKQSVRLIVTTIIEFYSDVPIYGQMSFCPPPSQVGLLLYWMGRNIPAATSNDSHWEKLKKFIPHALSKGVQWGVENPEIVAKMLAKLVAMTVG